VSPHLAQRHCVCERESEKRAREIVRERRDVCLSCAAPWCVCVSQRGRDREREGEGGGGGEWERQL